MHDTLEKDGRLKPNVPDLSWIDRVLNSNIALQTRSFLFGATTIVL
ncbi:hypothetical protein [Stenomitos frigidus]|nr:hypothetical protein [Stenomitos frigidus]